jgi:hypothetical protein
MIGSPFFFWFWGSLIVTSLVVPVYLVFVVFSWVEHFFAMITILWNGGRTVVGGAVGFVEQTTLIADKLATGGLQNFTNAVFTKYLPGTDPESQAIVKFGKELTNSVASALGAGYNQTTLLNLVGNQVNRTRSGWRNVGPE